MKIILTDDNVITDQIVEGDVEVTIEFDPVDLYADMEARGSNPLGVHPTAHIEHNPAAIARKKRAFNASKEQMKIQADFCKQFEIKEDTECYFFDLSHYCKTGKLKKI